MKKQPASFVLILLMALTSGLLQQSCKKTQTPVEPVFLTVNLPKLSLRNELFYPLDYRKESIEMEFSEPIDSSTIKGNISFADKTGLLDTTYTLVAMTGRFCCSLSPAIQ